MAIAPPSKLHDAYVRKFQFVHLGPDARLRRIQFQ